ncbi:MAG: phage protease [Lachnospiraceae bacterium]|nr:phage protease [Lachnospiraceae bacterium]
MLIIANSVGVESGRFHSVPNEIKILPVGMVKSQKGDFYVDEESYSLMKEDMESHGVDIVIDYEHQTLKDCQAPAGGWIKKLEYTPDAIVAKVEWTPRSKQYLSDKEYRYLSPVVLTRKKDRKAVKLHSLALTNMPAIDSMFPIINSSAGVLGEDDESETKSENDKAKATVDADCNKEGKGINLQKLREPLGLPADAADEEVMNALLKRLSDNETQAHKAEVENILDNGLRNGKILPYQINDMRAFAEADLDGFKTFISKAPQIVPIGKLNLTDPPGKGSAEEKNICETLGLSMEDYEKYGSMKI